MKFGQRLLMMTDLLVGRKKNLILSMCMIVCSFLLLDYVFTYLLEQYSAIRSYEKLYDVPLENIFQIRIDEMLFDDQKEGLTDRAGFQRFFEQLKQIDGIQCAGGYAFLNLPFDELCNDQAFIDIMGSRQLSEYDSNGRRGYSDILLVDEDYLEVIGLDTDASVTEEFKKDDGQGSVIAGSAFSDILHVGDTLTCMGKTYTVIGFLEKGARWPRNNVIGMSYLTRDMDYSFVINLWQNMPEYGASIINSMYYVLDSEADRLAVGEQAAQLCMQYNAQASMMAVEEELRDQDTALNRIVALYGKLLLFMIVLCLLTATSSSMISIMTQRRKIGIWYANGISEWDVCTFIFAEQFIRIIMSILAAGILGIVLSWNMDAAYKNIHQHITWAAVLGTGLVVFLVSVAVPCMYLHRQNVVGLLRARD